MYLCTCMLLLNCRKGATYYIGSQGCIQKMELEGGGGQRETLWYLGGGKGYHMSMAYGKLGI